MSAPSGGASWYRVARLRPQLRSHARIHRHRYRGRTWYVLQDLTTQRFLRFEPATYTVIGLMDGERTVEEVFDLAAAQLGEDAPSQQEIIQLLGQLHRADVLLADVTPDAEEILGRYEQRRRRQRLSRLLSPFAIRIPLLDPEPLLEAGLPLVRPLIGYAGLALWLAVLAIGGVLAALHWQELTDGVLDRILTRENAVLLWVLFPVLKALHELGHGFVTKRFGGEVHEMGIMFIVFTPVPYVDASSAWAFASKLQRVAVGTAGVMVELFLGALALMVWVAVEPGVVRAAAYNAIVLTTVASFAFNLNPLVRFDGYYILSDLIEIPNLRAKANAYLGYLVERRLFGREDAEKPDATRSERTWLVIYSVSAFLYRIFIVCAIALMVLEYSFFLGMALLGVSSVAWLGMPLVRAVSYLIRSPRLRAIRGRALATSGGLAGVLVLGLLLVPVPLRTQAEGVIWVPERALVRNRTEGIVERVLAVPGQQVAPGDALFELRDPLLAAELRIHAARVRQLEARYARTLGSDRVLAALLQEELGVQRERLARVRERTADLVVRSGSAGTLIVPRVQDLPGRFLPKGQLLAYVVDLDTLTVRAVVEQSRIDLVRERTREVSVRLAERLPQVIPARVQRIAPGALERLPSTALGASGGGAIAVDPRDEAGVTVLESVFQVDLEVSAPGPLLNLGGRAYVRFDHGYEPLAAQAYREFRQLLLSRLDV